ncbi:MG2 domain-containing protein [Chryseolinea sp. T2]|uniref:alpha-2-macroglobulin family protein n=1 Tax=Chryseolinea sp. T2 TaxID=3129255 RepID=UPI003076FCFC
MQKRSWTKVVALAAALVVVVAGIFYAVNLKGKRPPVLSINPAFAEYVSSYTSGVINSGSTIKISFAQDMVDSTSVGSVTSVKLFDFSPSVRGNAIWLDSRTVEYRPESRLISGQRYEVSFNLAKVRDMPKGLETFEYSFQVIPQNYDITISNVKPYVLTELTKVKVEGVISTADFADPQQLEKVLSAQQEGNDLTIAWSHSGDNREHSFTVEKVTRKAKASEVLITANGKSIGVDKKDDVPVSIPRLGDFKIVNVRVDQGSSQHIVIQFSDPLAARQSLTGLVDLQEAGSVDLEVRDNELNVYPSVRQAGEKVLTISKGIRNILDRALSADTTLTIQFEKLDPAIRFAGKGSILPATDGLVMPFEAVNLKAVDVRIIRIFEKNVLQFFQVNNYDGAAELRRVGRPILQKTISLENMGVTDLGRWNRYTLDLSKLITPEPGAIYQVHLAFKRNYLAYACPDAEAVSETTPTEEEWNDQEGEDSSWDSYDDYYYGSDYDWEQRDNPCHNSYYVGNRNISKNILASDLGLLAKRGGDGTLTMFANDLKTTEPIKGVTLEVYDFQQQLIGSVSTDGSGKGTLRSEQVPYMIVAKQGAQRGYLKVSDGESLSISNFDVGGERVDNGLKGLIYGERGVWRPGDSLYLTFLLEDKLKLLPGTHPVVFELNDPQGRVTSRIVRSGGVDGFYKFATATTSDAPTGVWKASVKVGGAQFTQPVRIETVKPNRLKINLDFGVDKLTAGKNNISGDLQVNWLHGAPGRNLRAEFEVVLTRAETKFAAYPDYTFDDPSRPFYSEAQPVFDDYTDDNGHARVSASLETADVAPGMLTAVFRGKAFEESGNFSVDRFTLPYYPFVSFAGIRLPPGDKARGMLLTDTTHRVDVVTVDADGKPVSRNGVEMSVYKLDWRWWWDNDADNASFMSASYAEPILTGKTDTKNGKGTWGFKIRYPDWGRYFVKAYDPVSGHATGKVVYVDWPGWAGRAQQGGEGATMLSFSSDKPKYAIGERATIQIPGSDKGRALVSIENGSSVLNTAWVETSKGNTPYSFDISPEMTPNVFVHITLVQPHAQTVNDLPMRLYGVIPLTVEDPKTHLEPEIAMPDVLEPGKEVTIKVSEKSNREMTYTLAVVDEGLLDLTRFKTPDAWNRFYAREALGVKTWDVYDEVIGAFGARLERLLAIGGDGEAESKEDDPKANRFVPVVKYFGPFTLTKGTKEHRFIMPQYVGSVKTMIVAAHEGAYGKAEKATPVRKPLMVLATLPRVLGPDENVKLPVTLFTMDPQIRDVRVEVVATGPLGVTSSVQQVVMKGSDMTIDFEIAVKNRLGIGKVEVKATSGKHSASDIIEIDVRNANPPVTAVQDVVLEAGKSWNYDVAPIGMPGTNRATLEVSTLPPINLDQRLKYLLQYPYGCVEQTVSAVFPQLYVDLIKVTTDAERATMSANIKAAITRLAQFRTRDGGFSYWPGGEDSQSWASTYAGHFLIEAEKRGYLVSGDMLRSWKKYERQRAQRWRKANDEGNSSELIQAYRLYALALADEAELGAMNRLRESSGSMPLASKWMLAAAYAKAGQPEAARKLIENASTTTKPYQEMAYSFGSDLRDKAIILETLLLLNERSKGLQALKDISEALSNPNNWMSTQTVAWCLKSAAAFAAGEKKGPLSFEYQYKGKTAQAQTELPIAQVTLLMDDKAHALTVKSKSGGTLFVNVVRQGTPARGAEEEAESNLHLTVSYEDSEGNPVDPSKLEQGQEFVATLSVMNPGQRGSYKNLALTTIFPSGWEIGNARLDEVSYELSGDKPDYQDIRDDRVNTFFDLSAGQRKTFKLYLTAAYAGSYYHPALSCEAMYDRSVFARKKGFVAEVTKRVTQ